MELQTFLKPSEARPEYLFKVSFNKETKIKRRKFGRSVPLIWFVPCLKTLTSWHSVIPGLPTHLSPEQCRAMALLSWRGPFPPQTVPEN